MDLAECGLIDKSAECANAGCGASHAGRNHRVPRITAAVFKPVCNRANEGARFELPSDGYVQIVPLGTATSMEGVRQLVDERAIDLMLANRKSGDLLMDREHESHDPAKRTDALAWLDTATLEKRPDGLYARPRLTNSGEVDVLGGTVRFISPEFDASTLEDAGHGLVRPTRLVGASFTNRPAFRQGKAVTNRESESGNQKADNNTMKENLCTLLKLDASTEDDVVLNRLGEVIAKAGKHDALAAELQTLRNREADAVIAAHDAVIPKEEELRKTLHSLILSNRAGADALIAGFKAAKAESGRAERKPLFNRAEAATPSDDAKSIKAANARAAAIKNRAQAIIDGAKAAGRTVTWNDAWATAEAEQE